MKKLFSFTGRSLCLALAVLLAVGVVFLSFARSASAEDAPDGMTLTSSGDDPVSSEGGSDGADAPEDGAAAPAEYPEGNKPADPGEGVAPAEGEDTATTGETAESEEHEETPEEKAERKAREKKERIRKGIPYSIIGAVILIVVILAVVIPGWRKKIGRISTQQLTESALMVAIATVCSLVKIDLPFGGGVTIVSMLPIIIISHRYGWRWGIMTGFVYSAIQLIFGLDNVGYATSFIMAMGIVFFDYLLAYTFIGLSGIFGSKRAGVAIGIIVTFCLRFLCHFVTGIWIWKEWMPDTFFGLTMTSPALYSALYNGWYMFAELVITLVVAMLIYKPLEKYFKNPKANEPEAPAEAE